MTKKKVLQPFPGLGTAKYKKSFFVILLEIPRYSSKLDDIKFEEL
jgi:hypothetical protein